MGFFRWLWAKRYDPEQDDRVQSLLKAAERERENAARLNYLTSRLIPAPRKANGEEKRGY